MRKQLTREEYAKKFEKLMGEFCYIPQEGEQIIQCKPPYPAWWFVSNKGYLLSAYKTKINFIKANYHETGKKNKDGKRAGRDWYYEHHVEGEKYNRHVQMSVLMAEHFAEDSWADNEGKKEVHHIKKKNQFSQDQAQECNRADNLQKLPKEVHGRATYYGSKSDNDIDADIMEKAKDVPHYAMTGEELLMFAMAAMQQAIDGAVIFETNGAADPDEREVKVKKINGSDLLEKS